MADKLKPPFFFVPLMDFTSEELHSAYLTGMTYECKTAPAWWLGEDKKLVAGTKKGDEEVPNTKLAEYVAKWVAEGKVRLGEAHRSGVSGTGEVLNTDGTVSTTGAKKVQLRAATGKKKK